MKEEKRLARKKYAERQFDKWIRWSFEIKGRIKYKDILNYKTASIPDCGTIVLTPSCRTP